MVKTKHKRANRLGLILEEKQISNKEFAKMISKSENSVSYWRNNARQPGLITLLEIAKVLGVEAGDLIVTVEEYFKD